MNVTEVEKKESAKHCYGNGCPRMNSVEHEEKGGALIDRRITENNATSVDIKVDGLLEIIISNENLNRAYQRVKQNKGACGVDGMEVNELYQKLCR